MSTQGLEESGVLTSETIVETEIAVAGRLNQNPLTEETAERLALEIETRQGRQADSDTVGERVLNMELGNVNFMPLPAPVTPEKPL